MKQTHFSGTTSNNHECIPCGTLIAVDHGEKVQCSKCKRQGLDAPTYLDPTRVKKPAPKPVTSTPVRVFAPKPAPKPVEDARKAEYEAELAKREAAKAARGIPERMCASCPTVFTPADARHRHCPECYGAFTTRPAPKPVVAKQALKPVVRDNTPPDWHALTQLAKEGKPLPNGWQAREEGFDLKLWKGNWVHMVRGVFRPTVTPDPLPLRNKERVAQV